jgi:hypothetical protein
MCKLKVVVARHGFPAERFDQRDEFKSHPPDVDVLPSDWREYAGRDVAPESSSTSFWYLL